MDFFGFVIPFLVILTILVFVHEMGHYLIARYNGVITEFRGDAMLVTFREVPKWRRE